MSLLRSTALFLFVAVYRCSATPELDPTTFKELTTSGKNGMVKFFQPWCGHCTSMKPAWDEASENAHSSVFLADVNCSDQADLCQENDVQGYPTIKVYQGGEVTNYEGGRDLESLKAFADSLAVKCSIDDLAGTCSEKAEPYMKKWESKDKAALEAELKRLSGVAGKKMTPDLKSWFQERSAILDQLIKKAPADDAKEL